MSLPAEKPFHVAIVGSGPAGLMAADRLASSGVRVSLYEKRKGLGRKLLIAGSSGLNITHEGTAADFPRHYSGPSEHFVKLFQSFPPQAWLSFIENELKIPTFKGTSRRYFVESEGMKASGLLKAWTDRLRGLGVEILSGHELTDFEKHASGRVSVRDSTGKTREYDALCLALGGGSWEPDEVPLRWIEILKRKGLGFTEFQPANCGYELDWPEAFLKEAEGKPIKSIAFTTSKGTKKGELVITKYGLEGTPVYTLGVVGKATLDLKPELDEKALLKKLSAGRENLSPIRRIKRFAGLGEGANALVFHLMPEDGRKELARAAHYLKNFPLELKRPRPLAESISSTGGLQWSELDAGLMLKKLPSVFAAGEMIDWVAPTGGFLIQGSVSQGHFVAEAICRYLSRVSEA